LNRKKIDPAFDGHLEYPLSKMNPKEKLLYLSMQIELRHFIKHNVRKISVAEEKIPKD